MSFFTKDVDSIGLEVNERSDRGSQFQIIKSGLDDNYQR